MSVGGTSFFPKWIGWWQKRRWRSDSVFALTVCALELLGTYLIRQNQPGHQSPDATAIALLIAGSASLVFRRTHPTFVLIFANAITLLYVVLEYPKGPNFLTTIIAFYSAVMGGHRLVAWGVLTAEFVLFPWLPYVLGNEPQPTVPVLFGLAGWLVVLATVAEIAHARQQRSVRAREEEARRRASEERLQIAHELHDVLGHTLSLMSVQAGVALHLMDKRPEQARVALSVIRDASKEALRELRSVLDVLRQDHEALPRSPLPGLASLTELVGRASEAGLQVDAAISGDLTGLPAQIDWAAFRIVQEALTNVMRHSGQTASRIQVWRTKHELTLQIDNEVSSEASYEAWESGQGIRGMKERAGALGGIVEAGPRLDGGFRVFARLPLDGRPSTVLGAES